MFMKKIILLFLFIPFIFSCEEVPRVFIEPTDIQIDTIMSGFERNMVLKVESTCATKSKSFDDVYFIALKIKNKGVGVWALGGSGGTCYATNDIAKEVSVYPGGQVSMMDDGAMAVYSCANKNK